MTWRSTTPMSTEVKECRQQLMWWVTRTYTFLLWRPNNYFHTSFRSVGLRALLISRQGKRSIRVKDLWAMFVSRHLQCSDFWELTMLQAFIKDEEASWLEMFENITDRFHCLLMSFALLFIFESFTAKHALEDNCLPLFALPCVHIFFILGMLLILLQDKYEKFIM
jgi:hypothetical protein